MQKKVRTKIKVMLVDDHPLVREGIKSHLTAHAHIDIVAEASNGREAIKKAQEFMPDVIFMDISMPDMSGLETTRELKKIVPEIKIVILTMHNDKSYILEVARSGAEGFLLKDTPPDELIKAIEAVMQDEPFFSLDASEVLVSEFVRKANNKNKSDSTDLSSREQEVLALIAEGFSNKEVASRLFVSVRTVETHRERIMRKLNIHSAAGLTKYAITKGIIKLS